MATTKNISALNPYVNSVPETDPLIWRVGMTSLDIGARSGTLGKASQGKNAMTIQHTGGKK